MIFIETKKEQGFTYKLEDIFGTLVVESAVKLEAGVLDEMVVLLLRSNVQAGELRGEVEYKGQKVKYQFKKAENWTDDEEESCENISTSTSKQESESTRTSIWPIHTWSWCKRFVGAFREAWKKVDES